MCIVLVLEIDLGLRGWVVGWWVEVEVEVEGGGGVRCVCVCV